MKTVWIIKADGTLQSGQGYETSLEDMAQELSSLGPSVLNMEKRFDGKLWPQRCGLPTGQVNAYEISEEDWNKLQGSVVGPNGFRRDIHNLVSPFQSVGDAETAEDNGQVSPWPWEIAAPLAEVTSAAANPVLIRELLGHRIRVYKTGQPITKDYIPSRVNFETDDSENIVDIWFG